MRRPLLCVKLDLVKEFSTLGYLEENTFALLRRPDPTEGLVEGPWKECAERKAEAVIANRPPDQRNLKQGRSIDGCIMEQRQASHAIPKSDRSRGPLLEPETRSGSIQTEHLDRWLPRWSLESGAWSLAVPAGHDVSLLAFHSRDLKRWRERCVRFPLLGGSPIDIARYCQGFQKTRLFVSDSLTSWHGHGQIYRSSYLEPLTRGNHPTRGTEGMTNAPLY